MRRVIALFFIALSLVVSCQASNPAPNTERWETGHADIQLQVETVARSAPFLWWEAEQPTATNFPETNPFAPASPSEVEVLSAGAWIGIDGDYPETPYLDYTVEIPSQGDSHWVTTHLYPLSHQR